MAQIAARFALEGELIDAQRYDGGHINDTYFAAYRSHDSVRRYVHQRINTHVFKDPYALTRNIARVTDHLRSKLRHSGIADLERRVLRLVPTRDGPELLDYEGEYWRTFVYVEGTQARTSVQHPEDAYAAARAFGEFAFLIADLPAHELSETIAAFHDTSGRYAYFERAVGADVTVRAAGCRPEIARARALAHLAPALIDFARRNGLPSRAAHNDSKITNVLFDAKSGDAVCVVDLDTVMPGLTLCDAGELIRTACTRAAEDEPNEASVSVEKELLKAVMSGFVDGAREVLSAAERASLVLAGRVLAYENALRFLTDYLSGDRYFRVHREDQNLHRARTQLRLAEQLAMFQTKTLL